ncbi:hypothetical protein COD05_23835 [Bacillus cereus]|nr:hypothetical protein CN431_01350 [Bacillus cereus]RFB72498.1 hypothetical protein DZB94_16450 [Bacillus sp. AW]PFI53344.1 hypothetical protein COI76_15455 [Bacillus cereus]PFM12084.1 hypothetical protein COJ40_07960 [Bacillus cereus]PFM91216.1 hypothetical protein COJ53_09275 [Bacillus cereus]
MNGTFVNVISLIHDIYLPFWFQSFKTNKKGHTYSICMRRCVLLQDRFRRILLLLSYHISY